MPSIPDQPTGGDDLTSRVTRLEDDVARLREACAVARTDADAARLLAAGADRDVSEVRAELRAHTLALNALRETQLEQGQLLGEHGRTLGEHGRLLDEHGRLLRELDRRMSDGFALLHTGMQHIVTLLERD